MRELRYLLELPDGSHRDEALIPFSEAEKLIRGMDWQSLSSPASEDSEPACPFMLFLDTAESFFMIMPETEGLLITAMVKDKWNLLGMVEKQKAFTLNFGILAVDDAVRLLKLFYEDKYAAMRTLEKAMLNMRP